MLNSSLILIIWGASEIDLCQDMVKARGSSISAVGSWASWIFFFFSPWNIVALQYCVSFYWTTLWVSYKFTYMPFLMSLPHTPPPSHPSRSSQDSAQCSVMSCVFLKLPCMVLMCVHELSVVSDSLQPRGSYPTRLLCPWDSPGKNTGVSCHFLLQRIFLTQGSNPCLLCLLHW